MTHKKFAFLFPGQGAQYVGMAKGFYDQFPIAKQLFEEADDILQRSLTKIVFNGSEEELTDTRNSQSGIFVASMAVLRVLQNKFPQLKPTVCAGLSLGEYTALCASGRLSFSDTLQIVEKRGRFMNDACVAKPGLMAVIMGLSYQEVENIVKDVNLPNDLWAANFNCPLQVVLSGTVSGIEAGMAAARERGAKMVIPLRVQGAFHSGLMQYAEDRLADSINQAEIVESTIDFVMNVPGDYVYETEKIRANLISQVTSPVRWEQSIQKIESKGVDEYVEMGCGKVLAGFNRRIGTKAPTTVVEHVEQLRQIETILS